VPVILPLTGPEAIVGLGTEKALTGLAKEINATGVLKNGNKIALKMYDNQSLPSVAVSIASQLGHTYPYLLNGSISNTEIPVNSITSSNGPVTYNISPAVVAPAGSYIFVGTASTPSVASDSLKYAHSQGWNRIALITSTDPSGAQGRQAVESVIGQVSPSLKLVANETFAVTDSSVSSQMAAIASAKPQAIVLWSTGPQIGTVFEAMRADGLTNTPIFVSYGNESFSLMKSLSSVLPTNLYTQAPMYMMTNTPVPAAAKPQLKLLYASYHTSAGHLDANPSYCDDGLLLFVAAINHLGANASASAIRNYIQSLSTWAGVDGIYHFSRSNHRGITGASYGIVRWDPSSKLFAPVSPLGG
jgi:branched-chain amino acid transport system substrate-binding protein